MGANVLKRLFKVEWNGVFLFEILFYVPEVFKFSYYANFVTDDVIGCARSVVRRKMKNISVNNEAMLLKFGRDVAPYKINEMVHILMLVWQHARFQSPASLNWILPFATRQGKNTWSYLRSMLVSPSIGSPPTLFMYILPRAATNGNIWFWRGKRLEPGMLPLQHQNVYHLVYFVGCNIPAKFQ